LYHQEKSSLIIFLQPQGCVLTLSPFLNYTKSKYHVNWRNSSIL